VASPNLELVRSIYPAWQRGDFSSAEWAHPEIEFMFIGGPAPGSWKGFVGMAEGFRDFVSAWEGFRVEAEQYRELDDEHVLVLSHFSGRGKTSGLELGHMRMKGPELFHVRGGKVTKLVLYWQRERAITDLRLASKTDASPS
jgi:ketosteroid isomerase-like protein